MFEKTITYEFEKKFKKELQKELDEIQEDIYIANRRILRDKDTEKNMKKVWDELIPKRDKLIKKAEEIGYKIETGIPNGNTFRIILKHRFNN